MAAEWCCQVKSIDGFNAVQLPILVCACGAGHSGICKDNVKICSYLIVF
jgi:hypothetical protein